MATLEDCEKALHRLADRMAAKDAASRVSGFDRSLSCTIRDLRAVFTGRLHDGLLDEIQQSTGSGADAQIRLDLTGDDLVDMVDGRLNLGSAWASGRIKVHAGVRDMMKLRSVF